MSMMDNQPVIWKKNMISVKTGNFLKGDMVSVSTDVFGKITIE